MTEQEIRALLIAAMAYDNRKPGEAAVAAWLEAATRARWPFEAALDALHAHYAASAEFVMPGHITARIRAIRSGPAPVAELLAIDSTPAETVESRMDAIRDFAAGFGAGSAQRRQKFADIREAAHEEAQTRRARVLRHADLAELLTQPPISHTSPDKWNGYIPPKADPERACERCEANGQHCRGAHMTSANASLRRRALIAICAEALRREEAA